MLQAGLPFSASLEQAFMEGAEPYREQRQWSPLVHWFAAVEMQETMAASQPLNSCHGLFALTCDTDCTTDTYLHPAQSKTSAAWRSLE